MQQEFRDYIGLGNTTEEAEGILINFFTNAQGDDYDRAICYLALANVEWQSGRLTERIKQTALSILDSDITLSPWEDARHVPQKDWATIFDLLFKDVENEDNDGLDELCIFYDGICYEDSINETKAAQKEELKSLLKSVADIPKEQDIEFKRNLNYSRNIAHILFLDKSPQKKYEMRIEELKKI